MYKFNNFRDIWQNMSRAPKFERSSNIDDGRHTRHVSNAAKKEKKTTRQMLLRKLHLC